MTTQEAIEALDALGTDDPEGAHAEADKIILSLVPDEVMAAYGRAVDRSSWWAYA